MLGVKVKAICDHIKNRKKLILKSLKILFGILICIGLIMTGSFYWQKSKLEKNQLYFAKQQLLSENNLLKTRIEDLENEDLRKTNSKLEKTIKEIESSFLSCSNLIEKLSDARKQGVKTNSIEEELALIIKLLSETKFASAEAQLKNTNKNLDLAIEQNLKIKASPIQSITKSQELPNNGYQRQEVQTSRGSFIIDVIAASVDQTKVVVDTASESDCRDNCPTLPLAAYISRNSGFAGINGSYFCPQEYPSCVGKTGSFDTLLMNSNTKKYFNSDNNIYSTVPLVVLENNGKPRFILKSLEWGRDTSINAAIANHPMLVFNGKYSVDENSLDGKQRSARMNRGFIATKAGTIFIGVVRAATVGESAIVLETLQADFALNLDGGGSSALYFNSSYKVGPGRNIPNAVVLTRR